MKQNKFRSIRTKLVFLLSLSAIIALLLSSIAVFIHAYNAIKNENITNLNNINKILSKTLEAPIEFDDVESAVVLLNTLKLNENIEGAYIFKGIDEMFASFIKNDESKADIDASLKKLYSSTDIKENIEFVDYDNIIISRGIYLEGEYISTFCIVANTDSINQSVKEQLIVQFIVSIVSLIIIIFLSIKLQSIFTKPIFILKDAMSDVTNNHNYDVQINENSNDEFAILFSGFNTMIHTMQEQTKDLHEQLEIVKIAEKKQAELVKVVEEQKKFVQTLLDSQEQLIITTNGTEIQSGNKTFLEFFSVYSIEEFKEKYNTLCVCGTFNTESPSDYLQTMMEDERWINYIVSRFDGYTHKVMISIDGVDNIFSISGAILPGNEGLKSAVFTNITEMETAKRKVESIMQHTRESIEYAALIQSSLVPDNRIFSDYFEDYFVLWHPKDTVGGDIYLFNELRTPDECLILCIDCTGHGVPGAFVTMLVKAVEAQLMAHIFNNPDMEISTAWVMGFFNNALKKLLKQDNPDSVSNVGWDGSVLYFNKKDMIIKFSGAESPFFYRKPDGEIVTVRGTRKSVGYKQCPFDFKYKESVIKLEKGTKIYLTTDGYLDQNGGEKGFPFGKKRFLNMIEECGHEPMPEQQEIFMYKMAEYEEMIEENDRNDDVTVIGLTV